MSQQQWASQYVDWVFHENIEVWNIDQLVWILQPNSASFWTLTWSWENAEGEGGYIGLQQEADGTQKIRFSLWNALDGRGENCSQFGGEGIGYTCFLPIVIDTNKFYRYRLWRQEVDNEGVWWLASLMEEENGELAEHIIGEIKVPLSYYAVDINSISNFVEFYGEEMNCTDVPFSIVGFTPPSVNYHGEGSDNYDDFSEYGGSQTAEENYCATRKKQFGNGAFVKAQPFDFGFANGVIMFLGGENQNPTFDAQTPNYLQNT